MTHPTKDNSLEVINSALAERDRLCEQCFQLIYKISRKASYLKLLKLAKNHLELLASYKSNR